MTELELEGKEEEGEEETEAVYNLQSLKYLLSDSLLRKFAVP